MNCWVKPAATEAPAGVTEIEVNTGGATVSVADAVIKPDVAVIVVPPMPEPVANPPAAMVATAVADEVQFTALVRFCMLPSLYVPVAANCWLVPFAMDAVEGVIDRETWIGGITETLAELVIAPEVAVIFELPRRLPITNPVALTDATAGEEDVHVTVAVTSCALPSV